jgi:hypothetical protein
MRTKAQVKRMPSFSPLANLNKRGIDDYRQYALAYSTSLSIGLIQKAPKWV